MLSPASLVSRRLFVVACDVCSPLFLLVLLTLPFFVFSVLQWVCVGCPSAVRQCACKQEALQL